MLVRRLRDWLAQDTPALPLDVFRILVGLLSLAFFIRLLIEIPEITSTEGLLDHALLQDAYWYTRVSLFQPGTPDWVFYALDVLGIVGAAAIIVGFRVKTWAVVLLVIEASTYRWNFLVMYLDDGVAHLVLAWLILLPVGRTLVFTRRPGPGDWQRWLAARVPAGPVLCLLLNVCLIYVLAGLWKLDSPLWRDGFGLYASVTVPVAIRPDVWNPTHLPLLEFGNYAVLAVEALLPLPMLLKRGNPLRYLGALAFAVFNAFIFFTLGIRFAILGLSATLVLFLRDDVQAWFLHRLGGAGDRHTEGGRPSSTRLPGATRWSIAFLLTLTLATLRGVPVLGALNEPAYAALWMVGVAQDYRLFNWIDRVNYDVETRLYVAAEGDTSVTAPPPEAVYPTRFRARLLQAYGHNVRWLLMPPAHRAAIVNSVAVRQAAWHCRQAEGPLHAALVTDIARITRENIDLDEVAPYVYAEYECIASPGNDGLVPRLRSAAAFLDSIPKAQHPFEGRFPVEGGRPGDRRPTG